MDNNEIERMLDELRALGYDPCISQRGPRIWRAHINRFGNFWADADSPDVALSMAKKLWERAGRPRDGSADVFNKET